MTRAPKNVTPLEESEVKASSALIDPRNVTIAPEIMEMVVVGGDLSKLTPAQRVAYYGAVCESVGLNPLTKPFAYISLNGKLTLYAQRDCTDQLRSIKGVSVTKLEREFIEGMFLVTAYGQDAKGRTDSAIGVVPIGNLQGENRANAMMKAETKAKRRLTLSIAGLGWMDESEVESTPAVKVVVDDTGEITTPAVQHPPNQPSRSASDYKQLDEPPGWEFDGKNARPVAPVTASEAPGRAQPPASGQRRGSAQRTAERAAATEAQEAAARDTIEGEYRETFDDEPRRAEGIVRTQVAAQGTVKNLVREEAASGNNFWHLTLLGDDLLIYECAIPMDTAIQTDVVGGADELESPMNDGRTVAITGSWIRRPDGMWIIVDGLG